ncbi:MAG: hypothetical protein H0X73_10755 [Chthoniobacterales bacterium]|nr:hypothetical protein [Chthoniobacterales bacterium]
MVLSLALCASAWADAGNKNVVTAKPSAATQRPTAHKHPRVYVLSTASAIPIPIERLGVFPTTTRPILILGRQSALPLATDEIAALVR